MAVDELGGEAIEHVVDGKRGLLLRHFGIEKHLQEQVAELAGEFRPVLMVDGFEDFVGLFESVGLDGIESLFAVPGATAGGAQALHNGNGALETFSGCGHAETNENEYRGRGQCSADAPSARFACSRQALSAVARAACPCIRRAPEPALSEVGETAALPPTAEHQMAS